MRRLRMLLMAVGLVMMGSMSPAQLINPVPTSDFETFVSGLRAQALAAGVSSTTFDAIIPTLRPDPVVIRLDRSQPGTSSAQSTATIPAFEPYRRIHVDRPRIEGGRKRYPLLRPHLAKVERETGVPEAVMLAIYGHETGYGANSGRFDLLQSLATLAYEGRRRAFFTAEFIAALQMIERGIPREQLRGSWAGATGFPQFMPSVYLRLARDGDGDGKADIWASEADALASIGAYLKNAGWRPGQPWGFEVRVPAKLDRIRLQSSIQSPRCPRVHARHSKWLTLDEWRALGVQVIGPTFGGGAGDKAQSSAIMLSLIEPDGPGRPAWLIGGNYRAILDYNCSNFYGLSVGLLADAIVE